LADRSAIGRAILFIPSIPSNHPARLRLCCVVYIRFVVVAWSL